MFFRTLAAAFFLLAACNSPQSPESSPQIEVHHILIDHKDPQDAPFPGGRGADQLIVYTPASGARTGTNTYGLEATVQEGVVTHVGDNNSLIPRNGWVLSGHGKASAWISERLFPGVEIRMKGDSLEAAVTVESQLYYAGYLLGKAQTQADSLGKAADLDREALAQYRKLSERLTENARKAYREGDDEGSILQTDSALYAARAAYHCSFPTRPKEVRAVWLAMQEKSHEALDSTLRKVAEAGFNTICPQVVFGGYAVYPGSPNLQQNPQFAGWDPMQSLVELSEKYQLELVPWVWVFFVGKENSPLAEEKSAWLAVSHKGVHPSAMEVGYQFFCPSRAEVRLFWLSEYRHLITQYQIKGLQLDYIRYPVSLPYTEGYCYCETCRRNFQDLAGRDPLELDPERDSADWQAWTAYRIAQVNDFVRETSEWTQALQPGFRLSADIFPDTSITRESKLQQWGYWLQQNWMSDIYTMTYTPDLGEVWRTTRELKGLIGPGQRGIVGLAPFMGLSAETLLEEIQLARVAGADGLCFFHFGSFTEEHLAALGRGPFRRVGN